MIRDRIAYYRRNLFRRQLSMVDVRAMAALELWGNPTISRYTFEGGVEHRTPVNPFANFRHAMDRVRLAVSQWSFNMAAAQFAVTIQPIEGEK
ncbi:hypothetical protein PBI_MALAGASYROSE_63 [Mycobacterium phage MalagasyRose]|uniref:Uncharacterized protein n=1 Tax=Mycobacterium phage MalagasyRose TaxID=2599870 RepID=A0A5J6TDB5_9CAUD|nr:hypothetical protein QEH39_gp25 [Mycobacterium phage MalagasyRose]QFG08911.1 hypothetical protein PBI_MALAGASYROSE_63 [Mycobacterium phage MalagasyRose]